MFLCLLNLDGNPVTDVERSRYAARMRQLASATAVMTEHIEIIESGEFVGMVAPAVVPMRPLWARRDGLLGVGNVRLDHPDEVRRRASVKVDAGAPDLGLALDLFGARGTQGLRDLLGDFALVIWDAKSRSLTAARDAFGVKTLFVGQRGQLLVLSSHLELVHEQDVLDEEYVADFLLAGDPGPVRTIWADSQAVAQGSILTARDGKRSSERFWDPFDFEPVESCDQRALIEQFAALFRQAVQTRIDGNGRTWAELSGGLDSSSIVCMAESLAGENKASTVLAGTISIVDELGDGDERRYSDLVVKQLGLQNSIVSNPWPWQDDGRTPPRTDEPRTHYPFFTRDRQICDTVRAAGAFSLTSGLGADHYLYGSRLFTADLVARGHPIRACREVLRWAVTEQRSFWKELVRQAVAPFFPLATPHKIPAVHSVPDWIDPALAKRRAMHSRLPALQGSRGPHGRKFAFHTAANVQELTRWLPRGPFEEGMELRYPFLYRPLVELGLRSPPPMRAQPHAPKWILREALSGTLPDIIRRRNGKGTIDARLNWGFAREQERISEILSDSKLASYGMINAARLKSAASQASRGEVQSINALLAALSLETWLFVRSNRWTRTAKDRMGSNVTPTRKVQSA